MFSKSEKPFTSLMACISAIVFAFAGHAADAAYPERPVRFIVGVAAGGTADFSARVIANQLSTKWGQPVTVENRPGASATSFER